MTNQQLNNQISKNQPISANDQMPLKKRKTLNSKLVFAFLFVLIIVIGGFFVCWNYSLKESGILNINQTNNEKNKKNKNSQHDNKRGRDSKRTADLIMLHIALEQYKAKNVLNLYPKIEKWEEINEQIILSQGFAPKISPPTESDTLSDYCYYLHTNQNFFVVSTNLEENYFKTRPFSGDNEIFNLDLLLADFNLISSASRNKTTCPNPQKKKEQLNCSNPLVLCFIAETNNPDLLKKIIIQNEQLEQELRKARDAKRITDLKIIQAALLVYKNQFTDKHFPKLTDNHWSKFANLISIDGISPPTQIIDSQNDYCYYVNDKQDTFVLSVQLEEPRQLEKINDINLNQGNFYLISYSPAESTDCINPHLRAITLNCSNPNIHCVLGGNLKN